MDVQVFNDRRAPCEIDEQAVRAAVRDLRISHKVVIGWGLPRDLRRKYGDSCAGAHTYAGGCHIVALNPNRSAASVSETIWHELTHARQQDALADPAAYEQRYKLADERHGYQNNPYEREADAVGRALASRRPLTRRW